VVGDPSLLGDEAETVALAAAVAESDADPQTASHGRARAWLMRLCQGDSTPIRPDCR